MAYTYSAGNGPAVLLTTEPANTDQIATSCAQSIRQIKSYINDATSPGLAGRLTAIDTAVTNAANAASTAQSTADGKVAGNDVFRAKPTADIDIVHGGAGTTNTDVTLGTELFDPDSRFGSSIFTAPANGYYHFDASITFSVPSGTPTSLEINSYISASSGVGIKLSDPRDADSLTQRTHTGGGLFYLTAGQTVKLNLTSTVDAAATIRISETFTFLCGHRLR